MYDGPSSLAATGAGITILGISMDITALLAVAALFVTTGAVMILRRKKSQIL